GRLVRRRHDGVGARECERRDGRARRIRVGRHGRDDLLDRPESGDDYYADDAELSREPRLAAPAVQGAHRPGGDPVTLALPRHLTMAELEAALDTIRQSPKDHGVLALIVRRPQIGARDVLEEGELDPVVGLVG